MWRFVVVVGGLLWLLTIGASAAMNAVAGYELGRSEVERYIFGTLGVAADGWKALAPIVISALVRNRKFIAALAATAIWIGCFAVAVTAAIGLAANNRSATGGGQEAVAVAFETVSNEIAVLTSKRDGEPPVRSIGEIEAAIAAVFARPIPGTGTIATISNHCGIDAGRTRTACSEIARLRIELAGAVEADRVGRRISELERERDRLTRLGGASGADPQAQLLSRMLRGAVSIQDVGLGLVLMLVAMVELVSAFAPVVLTEFVRTERVRRRDLSSDPTSNDTIELHPVGEVFDFMADCIRPAPGASVTVVAVLLSYQQWCAARAKTGLAEQSFMTEFERICRDELDGRVQWVGTEFRGMSLASLLSGPSI